MLLITISYILSVLKVKLMRGYLDFRFLGVIMARRLLPLLTVLFFVFSTGIASGQTYREALDAYEKGDYKTAVDKLKPLAEQGDKNAQFILGGMYNEGLGVAKDYKEGFKWLQLAANQGDANAQYFLGWSYGKGKGVAQDYYEALKWHRLAAEQGHAKAQKLLAPRNKKKDNVQYAGGQTLQDGKNAYKKKDYKKAFEIFKPLAEQGNEAAQNRLGFMYMNGHGVAQDSQEAFNWFRLSAEQGNSESQFYIGRLYESGDGVAQDSKEAIKWYQLASTQGNGESQFFLALMFASGTSVLQNYVKAYKWAIIASANRFEPASTFRDYLQERMTPTQIAESQRLASEWVKKNNPDQKIIITESPPSKIHQNKPLNTHQPPKMFQHVYAGTGFMFGAKDYVITNWHVVRGTKNIKVKFLNGEKIKAEVLLKNSKNDIVFLKLERSPQLPPSNFKIGDSSKVRMGDKVFTIGYPAHWVMGQNPKYTEGVVNALSGIKDDSTVFQISVQIQPGNSGGPLFNQNGEVIGITQAALDPNIAVGAFGTLPQNVNYAIKSSHIKNLLPMLPEALVASRGIVVVPTGPQNSLANFIDRAKNNIVLIEATTE